MKLGQALVIRADLQKKRQSLKERLLRNSMIQEGDNPGQNPAELIKAMDVILSQFEEIVLQINKANMANTIEDGTILTAALTRRGVLVMKHAALAGTVKCSTPTARFG